MKTDWNQKKLYYNVMLPYSKLLESMERNGFLIDRAKHEELRIFFTDKERELEKDLIDMAGTHNFRSTQQVAKILFNDLKFDNFIIDYEYDYRKEKWVECKSYFKTEKGSDSTSVFVLKKLRKTTNNHPFIDKLLKYRRICTIKSKFIDGLDEFITEDNRIHPDMFQLTHGGRVAVSKPALSQLPSRSEEGRLIKQIFIAPDGYFMVEEDLSAVELRGCAWICKEPVMWKAFSEGLDVHSITTARIFGMSYEEAKKDKKKRFIGKTINFAIIYGGSPDSIQRTLLKDTDEFYDKKECDKFIKVFYELYGGIKDLQNSVLNRILKKQNIMNYFGRYRYFPDINNQTKRSEQQAAMRQGMSHLIQSTFTGDMSAIKSLRINKLFNKYDGRYFFNFFDGFYTLVKEDQVENFYKEKKGVLNEPESPLDLIFPSEGGWGKRWSDLK
jgi:DNA polymerase I